MNICFGMQANKTDNDDLNTQIHTSIYKATIYFGFEKKNTHSNLQ